LIKTAALTGNLVEQIKYEANDELVSSDIVGCTAPAIYDSKATIERTYGNNIILYIWYDNEFGYSHQVVRLAKYIAKVGASPIIKVYNLLYLYIKHDRCA
jgi:glyceraldehyde 3-phosphate dehydrogenase